MNKPFHITIALAFGLCLSSPGNAAIGVLHDSARFVNRSLGLAEPQIQMILDSQIGSPRTTITFDGIAQVLVGPGVFDSRFIGQGILLEGISGITKVGGTSDGGPISGGGLVVGPGFNPSRIRVHFVIPGTTTPTTVARAGGFTTTPDRQGPSVGNCIEFFDSSLFSLVTCVTLLPCCPDGLPVPAVSQVEFLGAFSCNDGIAFMDIFSTLPYEVDLLTFSLATTGGDCTAVEIDIKPGSFPNAINLGQSGLIPVAVLSSPTFDADVVDADTVTLAGAAVAVRGRGTNLMSHLEDVNGDGLLDLVIKVEADNFQPGQFQSGFARLTGLTFDGQLIEGTDEIIIVPE